MQRENDLRTMLLAEGKKSRIDVEIDPWDERDVGNGELFCRELNNLSGIRVEPRKIGSGKKTRIIIGSIDRSPGIRSILESEKVLITKGDKNYLSNPFPPCLDGNLSDMGDEKMTIDLLRVSAACRWLLFKNDLGEEDFIVYRTRDGNKLIIAGMNPLSTAYGVHTVLDRIQYAGGKLFIDKLGTRFLPLLHQPAFCHRGVAMQTSGPDGIQSGLWENEWRLGNGYDYKGFIDFLVEHKINTLQFWNFMDPTTGLSYPSKRFPAIINPWHPNNRNEFVPDMIRYAHDKGIRIILFFDFPDRLTALIRAFPEIAAANCDVTKIARGEELAKLQKQQSYAGGGWVCAAKPKAQKVFLDFVQDVLEYCPYVDGIGAQFGEGLTVRCNCSTCKKDYFRLQWQVFEKVSKLLRKRNPDATIEAYRSPGSLEILKRGPDIPGFVWCDWGTLAGINVLGRSRFQGSEYLFHRSNFMWSEYEMNQAVLQCLRLGLRGFHKRGVSHKARRHDYQAFAEWTWNPYLTIDDYARLYTIKRLRQDHPHAASVYAHWIRAVGYSEMLERCRDMVGVSNPASPQPWLQKEWALEEDYEQGIKKEVRLMKQALARVKFSDRWIDILRTQTGLPNPRPWLVKHPVDFE